ncbi:MAG: TonB family protein [Myxococcales bacterium]|nr:TonB family protein [Myxococcales bacterium]
MVTVARPAFPLYRSFCCVLGLTAACASSAPSAKAPSPHWDEAQPRCYLGDAIAAGVPFGGDTQPAAGEARASRSTLARDRVTEVVHAHLEEVRYCGSQGMAADPAFAGDVVVRFTVGPGGHVLSSGVASSSVKDLDVQACVGRAVCRWLFEAPVGGGTVVVSYPFRFERVNPAPPDSES